MPEKEKDINFYDFLYEDKDRISFFFSQIFEGLTKEVETIEKIKDNQNTDISVGVSKLYAKHENKEEIEKSLRKLKDPSDIITLKLLEEINISNLPNFKDADEGALFLEEGSFYLVSRELLKALYHWFSNVISNINKIKSNKQKKEETKKISSLFHINLSDIKEIAERIKFIIPLIEKIEFETFVVFITKENEKLIGVIKEEYLKDSLNSYYLKYGGKIIPNTYLVGIKDYSAISFLNLMIGFLLFLVYLMASNLWQFNQKKIILLPL